MYSGPPNQNAVANTVYTVSASSFVPQQVVIATDIQVPIPDGNRLDWNTTDTIQAATIGIQAADAWTAITIDVEEWLSLT